MDDVGRRRETINPDDETFGKRKARAKKMVDQERAPLDVYLAKWGDEVVAGVTLAEGDRIDAEVPVWMRERISYDEKGIRIRGDAMGVDGVVMVDKIIERRVDVQLGLVQGEIEHLLALIAKEKFTVDESIESEFVRCLRDKLRGFSEVGLFEEKAADQVVEV